MVMVAKLESELLGRIFSDLLWHMAHEMETENHTYETSDKWEIPCCLVVIIFIYCKAIFIHCLGPLLVDAAD